MIPIKTMNVTEGAADRTLEGMKQYLLASDFDQTLSFNDSGHVVSEILWVGSFAEKVAGLARINQVQQGGELAHCSPHIPEPRQERTQLTSAAGTRKPLHWNQSF